MSIEAERLECLRSLSPEARALQDAGRDYVYLPGLQVPVGEKTLTMDSLLCLSPDGSYLTRLFLPNKINERGSLNWQGPTAIMGRNWWTWSWKDVDGNQPLVRVLHDHLRALK